MQHASPLEMQRLHHKTPLLLDLHVAVSYGQLFAPHRVLDRDILSSCSFVGGRCLHAACPSSRQSSLSSLFWHKEALEKFQQQKDKEEADLCRFNFAD